MLLKTKNKNVGKGEAPPNRNREKKIDTIGGTAISVSGCFELSSVVCCLCCSYFVCVAVVVACCVGACCWSFWMYGSVNGTLLLINDYVFVSHVGPQQKMEGRRRK